MATTSPYARVLRPTPKADGTLLYSHNLTHKDRSDPVELRVEIANVLPIIFVPGVMGSNLRANKDKKLPVWRYDSKGGIAASKAFRSPGTRQKQLHPDRTEVDDQGDVPSEEVGTVIAPGGKDALTKLYRARGWGEVGKVSYQDFLILLENTLNGHRKDQTQTTDVEARIAELMALRAKDPSNQPWRPLKPFVAPAPSDFTKLHDWIFPVYACGYNWLQDNAVGADRLKDRIIEVIKQNNGAHSRCEQVILITHSMGGLLARACQQLKGMEARIAGIVHGVMPADGAPVAYRRCKIGMFDEDWATSLVIGRTGQEVTAVFAQAPGALQLLPTQRYQRGWLEVRRPDGKTVQKTLHESNPYDEIYRRRDRWWALVKEEWLAPEDGAPIRWDDYLKFLDKAESFHESLSPTSYHPNTYAFYGADNRGKTRSFERLVWQMTRGEDTDALPSDQVYVLGASDKRVQLDGSNPEHVGQRQVIDDSDTNRSESINVKTISQWELRASAHENSGTGGVPGMGDGTVPAVSGRAPADCAKVRQVFRLSGVEHEPAYSGDSPIARQVTLYAICKIALEAKVPAAKS